MQDTPTPSALTIISGRVALACTGTASSTATDIAVDEPCLTWPRGTRPAVQPTYEESGLLQPETEHPSVRLWLNPSHL